MRFIQPPKAPYPIPVTLLGIVIQVRPEQSENAYSQMIVTLSPMTTLVRFSQPENANSPMLVLFSFSYIDKQYGYFYNILIRIAER